MTLEQQLSVIGSDTRPDLGGEDFERYRLAERVAINCCLLLTMYQTRLQPQNPEHFAALQRAADGKDRDKRKRAIQHLIGEPQELKLDQSIRFYEEDGPHVPGVGDGVNQWTVKPHWRKGHWRRVPVGPRVENRRKLTFIRPVLVHGELITDRSQSRVVYSGR